MLPQCSFYSGIPQLIGETCMSGSSHKIAIVDPQSSQVLNWHSTAPGWQSILVITCSPPQTGHSIILLIPFRLCSYQLNSQTTRTGPNPTQQRRVPPLRPLLYHARALLSSPSCEVPAAKPPHPPTPAPKYPHTPAPKYPRPPDPLEIYPEIPAKYMSKYPHHVKLRCPFWGHTHPINHKA